ncbi:DUF2490 domain-containing protein [Roseisolibacter sp. H3M3-2]|uniref:DUF2490 domain-containing protein n=1 Tax=Roseisolibacter sp. H3M3-2 TaxID=3031323 RepID=UPI0023D9BB8B|nr:DUF2490 domain-containing protein [Roseisolibacter sp. H3M3-2]MDF1504370.1 DUF2490 domain-containing protein [Roseisolibacter sp. H3M3-2]
MSIARRLLPLLLAAPLGAQTAPARRSVSNEVAWLQYFGEHRLDAKWSLNLEAQFRRSGLDLRAPQQLLLRPGVLYQLGGGALLGAGYAYAGTSVYGDAPSAVPFPEHRAWQMLQFPGRTGAVAWSHRLRTEQRWVGRIRTVDGAPAHDGYVFRSRGRAMTRATVDAPALGVALPKAYLTSWGELLINAGGFEGSQGQIFDQSRLAAQVGWRFTPRLRAEAGYMQQFVQRGGSRVNENNHALIVSLFAVTGAR